MPDNDRKRPPTRTSEELSAWPKARVEVFGREMIERVVKLGGSSGRVYLPTEWIDKKVKIIRID
ncbi:MAG: DUF2080 family transposase-associated protein [Pseudomonadota bacterium]